MGTASDRLWITWEKQRRNSSMADWLAADLHELDHSGGRVARYVALCYRTCLLLIRQRPRIVFFQNPSIVLSALVALLKRLRIIDCKIVGDFHNAGVFPPYGAAVCRWIARSSDLTIVSNDNLAGIVRGWGAQAVAIPDPLPVIHHGAPADSAEIAATRSFVFLFVCSWAEDEPIANVVEAARLAAADHPEFQVYITGRPKIEKYLAGVAIPASVTLTGFLSAADFDALLGRADVVIDLTTRADCMVCGAYESVAAEKPAILSDNPPTRSYFSEGVLFTDNSGADIHRQMVAAHDGFAALKRDVSLLKTRLHERERMQLESITELLAK